MPQGRLVVVAHQVGHDVYWDREDDGAVVLCRDAVQCLEVAKLGEGTLVIDICSWQKNSHFELVFLGLFSLLRSVYPERRRQGGLGGR